MFSLNDFSMSVSGTFKHGRASTTPLVRAPFEPAFVQSDPGRASSLSVVLPALNEASNLPAVMASIPTATLAEQGWDTEIIVVDNASTDATGQVARRLGARVVMEHRRGYGLAYRAGFAAAEGEVIATGDCDGSYPFEDLPELLRILIGQDIDFLTTDRLYRTNREAMTRSHAIANHCLSAVNRMLFQNGLHDSQSGMWVFHRYVWLDLDVRSPGMAFSQEIKNAAALAGYSCLEVPIRYRERGGDVKLHAVRDGAANLFQLFEHRLRRSAAPARQVPGFRNVR